MADDRPPDDEVGPGAGAALAQDEAGPGPTASEGSAVRTTTRPLAPTTVDLAAERVLAHLHLRLGSLALARAELETLAGRDALDDDGLVDLAEARWRTGDVTGAGEAAAVVLGDGEDGPMIVLVVAAEAALLRGRPSEARRYAGAAMAMAGGGIDAVFAGMPRGPVWPADSMTLSQPAPTLFDGPELRRGGTGRGGRVPASDRTSPARPSATGAAGVRAPAAGAAGPAAMAGSPAEPESAAAGFTAEPATIALWAALEAPTTPEAGTAPQLGATPAVAVAAGSGPEPELPAGDDALRLGREALATGDLAGASVHLALALRLTPALAPAVLDAIDGRTDRELAFVRGDAYRLVGREREARRAFADAMRPTNPAQPPTDPPSEGDPA